MSTVNTAWLENRDQKPVVFNHTQTVLQGQSGGPMTRKARFAGLLPQQRRSQPEAAKDVQWSRSLEVHLHAFVCPSVRGTRFGRPDNVWIPKCPLDPNPNPKRDIDVALLRHQAADPTAGPRTPHESKLPSRVPSDLPRRAHLPHWPALRRSIGFHVCSRTPQPRSRGCDHATGVRRCCGEPRHVRKIEARGQASPPIHCVCIAPSGCR